MCVWGVQGFGAHRGARVHDSRIPLYRWRQWNYSYATGKARHIWRLMHVACAVARVCVHANVFAGLLCCVRDILWWWWWWCVCGWVFFYLLFSFCLHETSFVMREFERESCAGNSCSRE
jgi:hypothetical protein